jgi:hypothetical protein
VSPVRYELGKHDTYSVVVLYVVVFMRSWIN